MPSARSQQALIFIALAFLVIYFVCYAFLIRLFPFPSAALPAAQVAEFYRVNAIPIRIGAAICSWTGAFMLPLAIVISIQLARLERGFPIWAMVEFAGGIMMTVFTVFPPLIWGTAAFSPERDPSATQIFHEFGNLGFITTDQYFVFQFAAVAIVSLTQKVDAFSPFPRWLGYFTIWTTLVIEVGVAGFLPKSGPFAWNGMFVFWLPIMMFGTWIWSVAILMLRAIKRQAANGECDLAEGRA